MDNNKYRKKKKSMKIVTTTGRGGSLVEFTNIVRRVVGSTPGLAAT